MGHVEIRRPRIEDNEELNQFFRTVIEDTFAKEGLSKFVDDLNKEIEDKKHSLKCDFDSNGKARYFLIALDQKSQKIIGTIEYGPPRELINLCTGGTLRELPEIGTVFVHPDYQRQGIGTLLFNVMILTLINKGINEFCLDSGYPNAQKIWRKKLGEPDYLLKDYWGLGHDHMIWRRSTHDIRIIF
ncbi:GNAT family N-acetyltransferase [Thermoactinomyces sp. CICC 10523]|uniref:GNAT family N-acetyltransferase n=1 Tax=Thermoactinomyces sp. CICC 10523 TaxID=2767428 RepID=UPI0018DD2C5F|nr:GNAT family N-acetyltransferase [Thermoactinomyces sp. CICC 10523]MBH8597045.1 GNAT family N-acetyltransferase [Thermoactinomyces sp. CICC 10523]